VPVPTRGPVTPPLAYKSHPGGAPGPPTVTSDTNAAHGLDTLLANLMNPNAPGAGLTPNAAPAIPGVGSDGVLGRQSVTTSAISGASPAMPRLQVLLAVMAILALSIVTAEYARGVLLRQRHAA
jgi:hypothetical protein